MDYLSYFVSFWLFLFSLYGIVSSRNLIHMINCIIVLQSSTYIFLLFIGYRQGGSAPVLADNIPPEKMVDPVVQAIALTDIVVSAVVAALLLAIAIQAYKQFKTLDPYKLISIKG
ncbi:Na(+)/H(+) antiporter subunit C [Legionella santicrucis]|uniref:Na(+)/H(+) antiporter subunit C n=1 Tax=Legionella santicrucis TaxID=45074 RepID=A0A0W0YJN3_9GAMM|nr:cation:proton antiporter subunit C [Legionella santicrucis]KTD57047.1 Na(+)/H(+) antiporter subunit C [Legionella santicrucis]